MNHWKQWLIASTVMLILIGCATPPEPPVAHAETAVTSSGGQELVGGQALSATATVEAIDLATREVVLVDPQGKRVTIVAGDQVRNLAQVKPGDQVRVEYFEAVALAMTPADGGQPGRTEALSVKRAPLGEKPAGVITRELEILAVVEAIDTANRRVTVRGPSRTLTLQAAPEIDLNTVTVGSQVRLQYVEAIAISVQAPK
jgi:hypothetical protein